jgi:hypothetical protein
MQENYYALSDDDLSWPSPGLNWGVSAAGGKLHQYITPLANLSNIV